MKTKPRSFNDPSPKNKDRSLKIQETLEKKDHFPDMIDETHFHAQSVCKSFDNLRRRAVED